MSQTKMKLTKSLIKAIEPTDERQFIYDTEVPGLLLRVYPTGTKSFMVQKRINNRIRKKVIGTFPTVSLDEARDMSLEVLREFNLPENQVAANKMTVQDLFTGYIDNFKLQIKAGNRRQRSLDDMDSIWRNHACKVFSSMKANEVTSGHAREFLSGQKKKSPAIHNKSLSLMKALYNYARAEELLIYNPFENFKKMSDKKRDRYLLPQEMAAFFESLEQEATIYQDIVRCLLFTGQRKACVLTMEWKELDLDRKLWHIPASKFKGKRAHTVPLPQAVIDILERRRRDRECLVYVFPNPTGRGSKGHISEKSSLGSFWRRIITRAGLYSESRDERLQIHDLRRTFASWQALNKESILNISKVLGHSDTRITSQVYAHLQAEQMLEGMETTVTSMIETTNKG